MENGDADGSLSDPYIIVTTTVSGKTTVRFASAYETDTSNHFPCKYCCYEYSSKYYHSPEGCIYMESTEATKFSSSSFQILLYDYNAITVDGLITVFNLTSAAVECRYTCLGRGFSYTTSHLG
jgi:hypothetical protein